MGTSSSSEQVRRMRENRERTGRPAPRFPQGSLLYGGPPVAYHPYPLPPGPVSHYVDPNQPPPITEVQKTIKISSYASVQRKSVQLVPLTVDGNTVDKKFQLKFSVNSKIDTEVRVYIACAEVADTKGNKVHLKFLPQHESLKSTSILPPVSLPAGFNQAVTTPQQYPIDLELFGSKLYFNNTLPTLIPIVITLSHSNTSTATTTTTSSSSSSSSSSPTTGGGGGGIQVHYTYLTLEKAMEPTTDKQNKPVTTTTTTSSSSSSSSPSPASSTENNQTTTTHTGGNGGGEGSVSIKVLKQQLEINGQIFALQEIYGLTDTADTGSEATAGGSEGDVCVVCLTNPRDSTVLPCRHMCLCAECSEQLRRNTNICPICRTPIEKLVTIKMTNKEQDTHSQSSHEQEGLGKGKQPEP